MTEPSASNRKYFPSKKAVEQYARNSQRVYQSSGSIGASVPSRGDAQAFLERVEELQELTGSDNVHTACDASDELSEAGHKMRSALQAVLDECATQIEVYSDPEKCGLTVQDIREIINRELGVKE